MFPPCFRTFQIHFYLSWLFSRKVWTTLSIMNLRSIITITIAILRFLRMRIKVILVQTNHCKIKSLKDAQHASKRKKYWQRVMPIKISPNSSNSRIKVKYIWSHRLRLRSSFPKRRCCKSLRRLAIPLVAWWRRKGKKWRESLTMPLIIRCASSNIRHSSWDSSGRHSNLSAEICIWQGKNSWLKEWLSQYWEVVNLKGRQLRRS